MTVKRETVRNLRRDKKEWMSGSPAGDVRVIMTECTPKVATSSRSVYRQQVGPEISSQSPAETGSVLTDQTREKRKDGRIVNDCGREKGEL